MFIYRVCNEFFVSACLWLDWKISNLQPECPRQCPLVSDTVHRPTRCRTARPNHFGEMETAISRNPFPSLCSCWNLHSCRPPCLGHHSTCLPTTLVSHAHFVIEPSHDATPSTYSSTTAMVPQRDVFPLACCYSSPYCTFLSPYGTTNWTQFTTFIL